MHTQLYPSDSVYGPQKSTYTSIQGPSLRCSRGSGTLLLEGAARTGRKTPPRTHNLAISGPKPRIDVVLSNVLDAFK